MAVNIPYIHTEQDQEQKDNAQNDEQGRMLLLFRLFFHGLVHSAEIRLLTVGSTVGILLLAVGIISIPHLLLRIRVVAVRHLRLLAVRIPIAHRLLLGIRIIAIRILRLLAHLLLGERIIAVRILSLLAHRLLTVRIIAVRILRLLIHRLLLGKRVIAVGILRLLAHLLLAVRIISIGHLLLTVRIEPALWLLRLAVRHLLLTIGIEAALRLLAHLLLPVRIAAVRICSRGICGIIRCHRRTGLTELALAGHIRIARSVVCLIETEISGRLLTLPAFFCETIRCAVIRKIGIFVFHGISLLLFKII